MKHTKKLAALFLALMMVFSLMAVTAAAYGAEEHEHTDACSEETIQPRMPAMQCPVCGAKMNGTVRKDEAGNRVVDFTCPNGHAPIIGIPW